MIIKPPDSLQARLAAQRATLPATDPASEARLRGLHQHLRGLQHSANDLDAQLADGTRWVGTGEDSPACKLAGLRAAVERRVSMERVAVVDLPPIEVGHA